MFYKLLCCIILLWQCSSALPTLVEQAVITPTETVIKSIMVAAKDDTIRVLDIGYNKPIAGSKNEGLIDEIEHNVAPTLTVDTAVLVTETTAVGEQSVDAQNQRNHKQIPFVPKVETPKAPFPFLEIPPAIRQPPFMPVLSGPDVSSIFTNNTSHQDTAASVSNNAYLPPVVGETTVTVPLNENKLSVSTSTESEQQVAAPTSVSTPITNLSDHIDEMLVMKPISIQRPVDNSASSLILQHVSMPTNNVLLTNGRLPLEAIDSQQISTNVVLLNHPQPQQLLLQLPHTKYGPPEMIQKVGVEHVPVSLSTTPLSRQYRLKDGNYWYESDKSVPVYIVRSLL